MNNSEYKKYHEMFMRNNHGSTAFHTFFCIFFTVQCALLCAVQLKNNGFIQYITEYFITVFPTILAHTVLSSHIYELNLGIFCILVYEFFKIREHKLSIDALKSRNYSKLERILSVSCLRGLTYLISVICILSVDFTDFPRHLAKTERYGYSLMDTGVGLFVLMSGLVHKDVSKDNYMTVVKSNIKLISILLLLGVTRYLSVKQLDYQEHVTEYGVHWNFFFTLAVCKFLSSILLLIFSQSFLLSILILILHEFLLYSGLENWVFSNTPRTDLIDANREGIASSLGFVTLYLFGASFKKTISDQHLSNYNILKKIFLISFVLVLCSLAIHELRPTSRTLANAGYCTFVSATLSLTFSVLYFFEIVLNKEKTTFSVPLILSDINRNGLFYFLIANLTTGLINMVFRTLYIPLPTTLIIINIYKIFTITLTCYVNKKGIKL